MKIKGKYVLVLLGIGVVLASFAFTAEAPPPPGFVYIDENDNGVFDAGEESWLHIQDAVDNASDGDTIIVEDGIYEEHVVITKSIVLKAGSSPEINGGCDGTGIAIEANDTRVEGLTVYQCDIGISAHNTSYTLHNITIDNCTVYFNDFNGIFFDHVNDSAVENSYVHNNSGNGIMLNASSGTTVANNTVENTSGWRGAGINLYYSDGNEICFNTLVNNVFGFFLDYSDNNVVEHNTVLETEITSFGSCPILYTWNGEEMKLFGDINGPGGLGYTLNMSVYGGGIERRAPTPVDYTALDATELVPENGSYLLEVVEEQDEITYLDYARLWVIDHAPGVEIFSPEASLATVTPYLYPPVIHTVRNPMPPVSATDRNGNDILPIIAAADGMYTDAELLTDNFITLDLGNLSGASQIKLVYRAYTDWSPIGKLKENQYVEVKNEHGEWEMVSPTEHFGKPEAMPRTYVIDITDWFKTDDWHVRLHTGTVKIHVDWIAVDTSVDEPVNVTVLEPVSAEHYYRGAYGKFEYFSGNFTRYGEVSPLLETVDDMYVIMRAGDSVKLRFAEQPPPSGERDFWLVTDAYFKQPFVKYLLGKDTSTVEPLPFHAMSNYPYLPHEHYPSGAAYSAYLSGWNTRMYEDTVPTGMAFPNSENNTISHNTIRGAAYSTGLSVTFEEGSRLLNNTISDASTGIDVYKSSNILMTGNHIYNNTHVGINIWNSDNLTAAHNTIFNNSVAGIRDHHSENLTIMSNTITDNGPQNMDYDKGGVVFTNTHHSLITGNYFTNNRGGAVNFHNSTHNDITQNDIIANCGWLHGIGILAQSNHTYVGDNDILNNTGPGIEIWDTGYTTVEDNNIIGNRIAGVYAYGAQHTAITGNIIRSNYPDNGYGNGIHLSSNTNHTTIENNTIAKNVVGIYIHGGPNGTGFYYNGDTEIHWNDIYDNYEYGVVYDIAIEGTPWINAIWNWWGAVNGPYDPSPPGDDGDYNYGDGDNVTDYVRYDPWLGLMLYEGWNLVSPGFIGDVENASDLAEFINEFTESCTIVSMWDAVQQKYVSYVVGFGFDFSLVNGSGYFVYVTEDVDIYNFSEVELLEPEINITLLPGYNLLGWPFVGYISASELADNITHTLKVGTYDAELQIWLPEYFVTMPIFDFDVPMGEGVFVYVTEVATWTVAIPT